MCGKMPCVVGTLKCFLHALVEICLIWEQRSPEWLSRLCSASVCHPRAALPVERGPAVPWVSRAQRALPPEPRLAGLLLVCPSQPSDGEIPPAVLGSSMCPLAEALSLCFASDSSSHEPAWASLAAFDPLCKSCLSYRRPGFLTLRLASHCAFYLPFSSVVLGFLAQSVIVPSCLNPQLSQTIFLSPLAVGRARSACVSAPPSKPSSRLAWPPASCPPGFNIG